MNNDLCIAAVENIKKKAIQCDRLDPLPNETTSQFVVGNNIPGKSIVIGVDNIIFKPRYTEMEIPFKDNDLINLLEEVDEIVVNGYHYYKLSKDTRK